MGTAADQNVRLTPEVLYDQHGGDDRHTVGNAKPSEQGVCNGLPPIPKGVYVEGHNHWRSLDSAVKIMLRSGDAQIAKVMAKVEVLLTNDI